MCGRYVIEGTTELSERFQLRVIPEGLFPTWNAAPSQRLPVILGQEDGGRVAQLMHWGLLPRWKREGQPSIAPINARGETLTEKPMFRGLVKRHRCIVPINGFYEWQTIDGKKQPFYITAKDGEMWGLAGLWDAVPDGEGGTISCFTVVTTNANATLRPLHERMPVILNRKDEEEWVSLAVEDPHQVSRLLVPSPDAEISLWPVSTAVNNVRNNGRELIAPMAAQGQLL